LNGRFVIIGGARYLSYKTNAFPETPALCYVLSSIHAMRKSIDDSRRSAIGESFAPEAFTRC
jgi:hypothetical protein